mgnify:CR=1 FL=1
MPSLFELQLKRNTRSNVGQAPEFLTDTATVSIVDCRLSIDMIFTDCRLTPEHRSLSTLTWSFWANIARHASSDIASPLSLCQQPADRTSWSRSAMAAWLGGILRQTNAHKHNLVNNTNNYTRRLCFIVRQNNCRTFWKHLQDLTYDLPIGSPFCARSAQAKSWGRTAACCWPWCGMKRINHLRLSTAPLREQHTSWLPRRSCEDD